MAKRAAPHVLLLITLLLLLLARIGAIETSGGVFELGRLVPSGFDLDELDGTFSPGEAASLCDAHPNCAGFTYRGLLRYTALPDQRQDLKKKRSWKRSFAEGNTKKSLFSSGIRSTS